MMTVLAEVTAALAVVGLLQAVVASQRVGACLNRPRAMTDQRPAVTVLKPLHGDEPLLEEALATLCRQDYPQWQVVFGVQSASDPAIAVVRRLQARFPALDITLVIDPAQHGANRKISNLINMLPSARFDILVIADSDVHVCPDYLTDLVAALHWRGVGLVTTLYAGLPGGSFAAKLGATQITHGFLPGAVLSRALGRQDCLGATMCLHRRMLERIGGLQALVHHLADDNVLGRRIAALGLRVALAGTVPLTTVPEATIRALFRHELRWARTIRALEPVGFAASILQYPMAWASLTVLLTAAAPWSLGLFAVAWIVRAAAAMVVDRTLRPLWRVAGGSDAHAALAFSCPVWLLPLRDILSVAVMLASYGGRQVDWRGHGLLADTPPPPIPEQSASIRPIQEINAR